MSAYRQKSLAKRNTYTVDQIDEYVDVIHKVIMYHDCHRVEAVDEMFPASTQNYKDEWIRLDGENAVIGISDYAQHQLGDIVFVELPEVGRQIEAGESFGVIESVKAVSELYAPVSGTVAAVNEALEDSPESVNEDCYGAGWMYKLKPDDPSGLGHLIHGAKAVEKWLLADIEKYR